MLYRIGLLVAMLLVAVASMLSTAQASRSTPSYRWRLFVDSHPAPLFYASAGVATGFSGNIFIADPGDHRLEKFSPSGTLLASWGTDTSGPLHLEGPRAVAVDGDGNIYLADNGVLKLSFTGQFIAHWTGGVLSYPRGLAIDRQRNVYVLSVHPVPDSPLFDRLTITKLARNGKRLATLVYNYPQPLDDALLAAAMTVAPDGNLLLSIKAQRHCHDCDGTYYVLRTVSPTGKTLDEVSESGGGSSITTDSAGTIYIAVPHAIQKLSPAGALLASFGTTGCGSSALGSDLQVAASSLGPIFVGDTQPVARSATTGVLHQFDIGGVAGSLLGACPSATQQAQFGQINDLAVTPTGTVYAADGVNNLIYRFARDGTAAGSLPANHPSTVSVDHAGNVYIPDLLTDTISKFSPGGALLGRRSAIGIEATAVARNGQIFALRNDGAVQVLSPFGQGNRILRTWRMIGYPPDSGGLDPEGICLDGQGNVWLADIRHNNIQKFSPTGHLLLIFGRGGTVPGRFHNPNSLTVDGHGHLFVSDGQNNRVQEFDLQGHFLQSFGRQGQAPGQFQHPWGIGADAAGDLFVGDRDNDRVQELVRQP